MDIAALVNLCKIAIFIFPRIGTQQLSNTNNEVLFPLHNAIQNQTFQGTPPAPNRPVVVQPTATPSKQLNTELFGNNLACMLLNR